MKSYKTNKQQQTRNIIQPCSYQGHTSDTGFSVTVPGQQRKQTEASSEGKWQNQQGLGNKVTPVLGRLFSGGEMGMRGKWGGGVMGLKDALLMCDSGTMKPTTLQ